MPATYPTALYLELALKSNSIWPEDANKQEFARFQAQLAADGARDQFENLTKWGPALAKRDTGGDLIAETRTYGRDDVNHMGDLQLRAGLLRLDSVSIAGQLQTRSYTPFLQRYTSQNNSTVVAIKNAFGCGYGQWVSGSNGLGEYIEITGVWGLFTEVPADVFLACQKRAMATMMDLIENLPNIASISMDGFSKGEDVVGVRTQKDIAETGDKDFLKVATNYRRPASF